MLLWVFIWNVNLLGISNKNGLDLISTYIDMVSEINGHDKMVHLFTLPWPVDQRYSDSLFGSRSSHAFYAKRENSNQLV